MSYSSGDDAAIRRERTMHAAARVDDIADWASEQSLGHEARAFYLSRADAIRNRADNPPGMDRAVAVVRRILGGR